MKLWWSLLMFVVVGLSMMAITATAESDLWEEDDKEVLVRTVRGTKERGNTIIIIIIIHIVVRKDKRFSYNETRNIVLRAELV